MTENRNQLSVDEAVGRLVKEYGVEPVRLALAKVSDPVVKPAEAAVKRGPAGSALPAQVPIPTILDALRESDQAKYLLLLEFYNQLKDKKVLVESQDIRIFTHLIGLKDIQGKARRELIPELMRFLLRQPMGKLQTDIAAASNISEQQRQKGFSIITDMLMEGVN